MQPAANDTTVSKMKRAVRRAEASAMDEKRRTIKDTVIDSGTGFTILKLTTPPVTRLVDKGKIGPEALQAAQEIVRVFEATTGSLLIRPPSMEKQDRGYDAHDPGWMVDAAARYKQWMNHWSSMAKRGHPLFEVVIAAVYDLRPLWTIAKDLKMRSEKAEDTLICGLQDYAARAGWVRGKLADDWRTQAENLFRLRTQG